MTASLPLPTGRQARRMKIDSYLYPPPSMGEGEGGGGCPDHVPPHLNPLPLRGEEALGGVIF